MKRFGHIVAVLAFAFALLMGAAGGALAHVDMHAGTANHHGSHDTSPTSSHDASHKAALVIVAPCCPAAEAPDRHAIAVPSAVGEMPWHPRPEYTPGARDVTPEPPPPKTAV